MFLIVYWLLVQVVLKKISNFGFPSAAEVMVVPSRAVKLTAGLLRFKGTPLSAMSL